MADGVGEEHNAPRREYVPGLEWDESGNLKLTKQASDLVKRAVFRNVAGWASALVSMIGIGVIGSILTVVLGAAKQEAQATASEKAKEFSQTFRGQYEETAKELLKIVSESVGELRKKSSELSEQQDRTAIAVKKNETTLNAVQEQSTKANSTVAELNRTLEGAKKLSELLTDKDLETEKLTQSLLPGVTQSLQSRLSQLSLPIGSITAFGGEESEIPDGWLPCKGQEENGATGTRYERLFKAIKWAWGRGKGGPSDFNLPDLRGYFLRGTTDDDKRDPDFATRTVLDMKTLQKGVGSYQSEQLRSHAHPFLVSQVGGEPHFSDKIRQPSITAGNEPGVSTLNNQISLSNIGSETRPKNAAVLFIIKAE